MDDGNGPGRGEGKAFPVAGLGEIARVLDETARLLRRHPAVLAEVRAGSPPRIGLAPTPAMVRAVIETRRWRGDWLGVGRGDPAWSMMLELYAARLEGRRVTQTRLGAAAGVAETTALRLTRRFVAEGLFTRAPDPDDARALLIGLSDATAERVGAYLAAAMTASPLVP